MLAIIYVIGSDVNFVVNVLTSMVVVVIWREIACYAYEMALG